MKLDFYKKDCCGVDSVDLRRCPLLFRLINKEQRKWFCYVRKDWILAYAYHDNKFTCVRQAKENLRLKFANPVKTF